ncbi:uncharacterized protein N7469_001917 [Penicillium citrinum]|uniref:Uncharacterized protein n=1 Tax=Penicillium citrinum TaxID=5077 RepID=A0A9W9PA59_PENCI|nr:uncharacterized protein N7469_001917 [Penicillium citrinum]KAJ5240326.1 hypothetical protein N7469_001917 [Penicillium citrinum]
MPPQRNIRLQPYSDDCQARQYGVPIREGWIGIALANVEYEFSMLQLERNNLASMLQFYERDKTHLEDSIQQVKETAKLRNERLTQEIEELMAELAGKQVEGK